MDCLAHTPLWRPLVEIIHLKSLKMHRNVEASGTLVLQFSVLPGLILPLNYEPSNHVQIFAEDNVEKWKKKSPNMRKHG